MRLRLGPEELGLQQGCGRPHTASHDTGASLPLCCSLVILGSSTATCISPLRVLWTACGEGPWCCLCLDPERTPKPIQTSGYGERLYPSARAHPSACPSWCSLKVDHVGPALTSTPHSPPPPDSRAALPLGLGLGLGLGRGCSQPGLDSCLFGHPKRSWPQSSSTHMRVLCYLRAFERPHPPHSCSCLRFLILCQPLLALHPYC